MIGYRAGKFELLKQKVFWLAKNCRLRVLAHMAIHDRVTRIGSKAAAIMTLVAALESCSPDPYMAPPARPGYVLWQMVAADAVAAACGHPNESRVVGCEANGVVTTRFPAPGDYTLIDTLAHEVSHAEGWRHQAWDEEVK